MGRESSAVAVYAEDLPASAWTPRTCALLAARGIDVIVSVRPGERELERTLGTLTNSGVGVVLWPMLRDEDGRWASEQSADRFAEHVEGVVSRHRPKRMLFDLEPPIADVRAMIAHPSRLFHRRLPQRSTIAGLVHRLRHRNVDVEAAVAPMLAWDAPGARPFEKMLGTPAFDLPFSRVSPMAYSSLFEGYGRGAFDRPRSEALLACFAHAAVLRFETRASLSLGATGVGALGDERPYASVTELARDVAIARGAGVPHLSLFDLRGVLARPPAEAWLDALVETEAGPAPADSLLVDVIDFAARAFVRGAALW